MALRTCSIWLALAVFLIVETALVPGRAAADNFHPGRVLERGSNNPVAADVKAWAAAPPSKGANDCPEFGKAPVDARTSDPSSGEFVLNVPEAVPTYHVTYCVNGYHNKVNRHLPNSEDGSPIIPRTAFMRKQSVSANLRTDVVRLAVFALNELAYLRDLDEEAFKVSLARYGEQVSATDKEASEVVSALPDLIARWASR